MVVADPRPSLWRVLDERNPRGGRLKGWLFVTHPGPSLLVTAVTVAAAGLLIRRLPSERTAVGLVLVMLPAQLAIGAVNDWADARSDAVSKTFKPIVRGCLRRGDAALLAAALLAVSLGAAAFLGVGLLATALLAAGAGISYDLLLKRTPAALIAWWAGFTAVPLTAMVITGRLRGSLEAVPLALLLAVGLLIANGLPDAEADRLAGARTLPSVLGERLSRTLLSTAMLLAAGYVLLLKAGLGQDGLGWVAAAVLASGALAGAPAAPARRLGFPLLAICVAVATVSWLAALPVPGA